MNWSEDHVDQENDSHQAPLILCLHYPNKYIYIYIYIYSFKDFDYFYQLSFGEFFIQAVKDSFVCFKAY